MTATTGTGQVIGLIVVVAVLVWAVYIVGRHDPRYRRAVRAVERAAAREAIRSEYDDRLAELTRRCDFLNTRVLAARDGEGKARRDGDEARAELAAAAAALERIDALAANLYSTGQLISARRIVAARRDCTISEVVLGGDQVDGVVRE